MLQRQPTLGPPAYSTVTASPNYQRPAVKVQPVALTASHLFSHASTQVRMLFCLINHIRLCGTQACTFLMCLLRDPVTNWRAPFRNPKTPCTAWPLWTKTALQRSFLNRDMQTSTRCSNRSQCTNSRHWFLLQLNSLLPPVPLRRLLAPATASKDATDSPQTQTFQGHKLFRSATFQHWGNNAVITM